MKTNKILAGLAIAMAVGVLAMVSPLRADTSTNQTSVVIPYPLTTCPVSDDKLGEMGPASVFVYQGQEIKFCCPDCKKDFLKDPQKYLKQIKADAAKQTK